jgi:trimeric autotransporter adhesin
MRKLSLLVFALSSLMHAQVPPDTCTQQTWVTNGSVRAICQAGYIIYIGGLFTRVGPYTGCGVPVSASTGTAETKFPKVNGTIHAVCPDGNGGWYIGGIFTKVNGVARNNIAHVAANGDLNPLWNPDGNGQVLSLVRSGITVYAGGSFSSIGGQTRNRIAGLVAAIGTATTGGTATAWNPGANGGVQALAVSGTTVYAGGSFTSIGGQARNFIAALDSTTGTATTWNPSANNGDVLSLVVSGSTIYAGGQFTSIGTQARNRIAAIDGTTGIATDWNPNANSTVRSLVLSGSTVYAGGDFTTIDGQPRNNIAALEAATGKATAWNPNANYPVYSLAVNGSTIYAGGTFYNIGGQARDNIAALDAITGAATEWNPRANYPVYALAVWGSSIYAGGQFSSIGGQDRNNIAALDGLTGIPLEWNPNANYRVLSLATNGATVYAGGGFTNIGGQPRNYIAALNVADGTAVAAWNPNANGDILSLAIDGPTVYTGGWFTSINGKVRNYIAALDASSGTATDWDPKANSYVTSLATHGAIVYAGGNFTNIGRQPRGYIAALNAASGDAVTWSANANGRVNAIVVSGATLYAGGVFTSMNGQPRNRIAALDAASGNVTAWNPDANNIVFSLAVDRIIVSTVYAGGLFTNIGGQSRINIAALDTTTGAALSWNPNANGRVYSLAANGSTVYTGGDFTALQGSTHHYFAQFGDFHPAFLAPVIQSIAPSSGFNDAGVQHVHLIGASFLSGATVILFKTGQPAFFASIQQISSTYIDCLLNLTNLDPGAWDVIVTNPDGQSGILPGGFTVLSRPPVLPAVPSLCFPLDGATHQPTSLKLYWHPSTNAQTYQVQIGLDIDFSTIIGDQRGLTDTSFTAPGLSPGTPYYWRVNATNEDGTSGWSPAWSFFTDPPPLLSPIGNQEVDEGRTVRFPVTAADPDGDPVSVRIENLPPGAGFDGNLFTWTPFPGDAGAYSVTVIATSGVLADTELVTITVKPVITDTLYTSADLSGHAIFAECNPGNTDTCPCWPEDVSLTSHGTYGEVISNPRQANTWVNADAYRGFRDTFPDGSPIVRGVYVYRAFVKLPARPTPDPAQRNNPEAVHLMMQLFDGRHVLYPELLKTSVEAAIYWDLSPWHSDCGKVQVYSSPDFKIDSLKLVETGIALPADTFWHAFELVVDFTEKKFVSITVDGKRSVLDSVPLALRSHPEWGDECAFNITTESEAAYPGKDCYNVFTWATQFRDLSFGYMTSRPPEPVSLVSPENFATEQPLSPRLLWETAVGTQRHHLQISSTPDFSSLVVDNPDVTARTAIVNPLSYEQSYYWRVRTANALGTSEWSPVWRFSTGFPSCPPILVAPANGASAQPVSFLELVWLNPCGVAVGYDLQLSPNSDFSVLVVDLHSSKYPRWMISGLSYSAYYFWRAKAVYPGSTSEWSQTWSFTTLPPPPEPPVLAFPGNGASNQPLAAGLHWQPSAGADSYGLQVSRYSDFSSLEQNISGLTELIQWISNLSYSTTYFWRVNATSASGTGVWSQAWTFTTVPEPPMAPGLLFPSYGAAGQPIAICLHWQSCARAASYGLQVSRYSDFSSLEQNLSGITELIQWISNLSYSTTYFWRVNATNTGGTSGWSQPWSFTTMPEPPMAPVLVFPGNGASNQPLAPTLLWHPAAGTSSFGIQISLSNDFSSIIVNQTGLTDTSATISLSYNTLFYWRVNATNTGGTSGWSQTWSFTTAPDPPMAPVLVFPGNGATHQPLAAGLHWQPSARAVSYGLQVSRYSDFSSLEQSISGVTELIQWISNLSYATTYFWRVNATNAGGTSGWSQTWSFATVPEPPAEPVLLSPPDGAVNIPVNVDFRWMPLENTLATVEFSLEPSFAVLVAKIDGPNSGTTRANLSPNLRYYWRVAASNAGGRSPFSQTWSFTTGGYASPATQDPGTVNGSTNNIDFAAVAAINNRGTLAGYAPGPDGNPRAVVINRGTDATGSILDDWYRDADNNNMNDLMTDISTALPANTHSWVRSLNTSQHVAGEFIEAQTGLNRGFVWSPSSGAVVLERTAWGSSSAADINNAGMVVGSYVPNRFTGNEYAFILVPRDANGDGRPDTWFADANSDGHNDLIIAIGTSGNLASAKCINSYGQVVVSAAPAGTVQYLLTPRDANGDGKADTWFVDANSDGRNDLLVPITSCKPGYLVNPFDMNDKGQVVGNIMSQSADSSFAFIWSIETGMQVLKSGNQPLRCARAINSQGWVAGDCRTFDPQHSHGYLWINDDLCCDLGVGGGTDSYGNAVNDSGIVAGSTVGSDGLVRLSVWLTNRMVNTMAGQQVEVQPVNRTGNTTPVQIVFNAVQNPGVTSLTISRSGPALPSGFRSGSPPLYYEISSTAAYNGQISICIDYSGTEYRKEQELRLYHYENGTWVDCTSDLNTTTNRICGMTQSLSPFAILQPEPYVKVTIDIKPGEYPNVINLGSKGTIPVAIMGEADFDVTQINPLTITLSGTAIKLKGNGTPMSSISDVNGDSIADMVVHISTEALRQCLYGYEVVLDGRLYNGEAIQGADIVQVIK